MCGTTYTPLYSYPAHAAPKRRYQARYEAAQKERIIITGPCGEERVLTVNQAVALRGELDRAIQRHYTWGEAN